MKKKTLIRYAVFLTLKYNKSKQIKKIIEYYTLNINENIDDCVKEFHNKIFNHILVSYSVVYQESDLYYISKGNVYRNSRKTLVKKEF